MRIRSLTEEDYMVMLQIWERAGLSFRPEGRDEKTRLRHEMKHETAVFLGAEEAGRLIGVVLGTHDGRKGWINRLAVLPEHRHKGIGRRLVEAVEERLQGRGIRIVTCLIEGDNEASMRFFESLGYVGHPDITYYSKRSSPDW